MIRPTFRISFITLLLCALLSASAFMLKAQRSDPTPEAKQFQTLEDNWSIAFVKKDQYAMELLLAPSFVNISAAGGISTRNQLIAEMFDHSTGNILSMEQRAVTVRMLGDLAIVDGTYVIHYQSGAHTVDERGVFTHLYQRTRASWACVHAQRTAVFDQSDERQKQATRRSSAALPFHVPLLYKGADSAPPATPASPAPPAPGPSDKQTQQ